MSPERGGPGGNREAIWSEPLAFPEDPQERFDAVYGALANSAVKIAVFLLTDDDIGDRAMHAKFASEAKTSWVPDSGTIHDYYLTFQKAGLIVKTDKGYRRTPAGEKYGVPIAAHLLQQFAPLPAMVEFGQTAKKEDRTRSIVNQANVISVLNSEEREMSVSELGERTGVDQTSLTVNHLRKLRDLGVVDFVSRSEPLVYRPTDKEIPTLLRQPWGIRKRVLDIITRNTEASVDGIIDELRTGYPRAKSDKDFRSRVTGAIKDLYDDGVLTRISMPENSLTKVSITPLGAYMANSIIDPIREALSDTRPDLLESWGKIPWVKYIASAAEKHVASSPHINQRAIAEGKLQVLDIIRNHDGIDKRTIGTILGVNPYGALYLLRMEGLVLVSRRGNSLIYTINPNPPTAS